MNIEVIRYSAYVYRNRGNHLSISPCQGRHACYTPRPAPMGQGLATTQCIASSVYVEAYVTDLSSVAWRGRD